VAPVVEARGWGWRHAGRRDWALRGVNLRIEAGERVLLLGASGAGKSTLLLAIAGLLEGGEAEGELLVHGLPPRAARDRVGILFQDPESQLVMARAGDEVAFGLENRCVPATQIWPRVDAALAEVGFNYARSHPTDALSGGEQQRLALAGTLALEPDLLLLDEPTANLDVDGAALLGAALRAVATRDPSRTLVMVEHRVAAALPLVERAVVVSPSGVLADGPPAAVFAAHGDRLAEAGVWVPDHPLPATRAPAAPGAPLLTADRLRYRYPGSAADALPATSLQLHAGEALAVVGPNGCGKSTLALLLGGLLRPTGGEVTADAVLAGGLGADPARWPAAALARGIGSVFQDPEHQLVASTVRGELLVGGSDAARADELLARLRLDHLAAANPFTLSGGEKRRLSVATALAAGPSVLVLDEPTFGQDRRTAVELLAMLGAHRDAGGAVCFVTHDAAFAEALADRTLRISRP
jgi:energy-coupling factor transport system ATP-binding protein